MPPEQSAGRSPGPVSDRGGEPQRDKVRLRFRKTGTLRLVSHHDLMRCFERMLRRADLPFASTEGFNPKPRLVFALSLALGIAGLDEWADLELAAPLPPEEVRDRLRRQAPPGLEIVSAERVPRRARLQVRQATYRLPLPPDRQPDVTARAAELLAAAECWVERSRPAPRRFDLRPYLAAVRVLPDALELDLTVTPTGSARPDEVLRLLGLADLLDAGAVLERTRLELLNEPEAQARARCEPGQTPTPEEPEEGDGIPHLLVGPDWAQTGNDTPEGDA
jgi:radical SAM-linked protein